MSSQIESVSDRENKISTFDILVNQLIDAYDLEWLASRDINDLIVGEFISVCLRSDFVQGTHCRVELSLNLRLHDRDHQMATDLRKLLSEVKSAITVLGAVNKGGTVPVVSAGI